MPCTVNPSDSGNTSRIRIGFKTFSSDDAPSPSSTKSLVWMLTDRDRTNVPLGISTCVPIRAAFSIASALYLASETDAPNQRMSTCLFFSVPVTLPLQMQPPSSTESFALAGKTSVLPLRSKRFFNTYVVLGNVICSANGTSGDSTTVLATAALATSISREKRKRIFMDSYDLDTTIGTGK